MKKHYEMADIENKIERLIKLDDDLINEIIEDVYYIDEDEKNHDFAIICLSQAMETCDRCFAETDDKAYYHAHIRFLTESFEIHKPVISENDAFDYYTSIVDKIEDLIYEYPDKHLLKALMMETLEDTAIFFVENELFDKACNVYNILRDKLIEYEQNHEFELSGKIAKVNKDMLLPLVMAGKREEAINRGMEAFMIYNDLLKEEKYKFTPSLIQVCANLGGLFIENGDLKDAQNVLNYGKKLWVEGSFPIQTDPDCITDYKVLVRNYKKLQELL